MAAVSSKLDLLENLKSDIGIAGEVVDQVIELTPHLVLAVALLYMIASDGEIEDQESSQLQSVLGGDKEVLRYGLAYVQSTPIDQFLQDAPDVLSHKDSLCILTNVCDSLLSDGHADEAELALFHRMVSALGLTQQAFDPYFKTIALKNDKTVLGPFTGGATEEISKLTPHHALAISLLYMMTADGAIGSEEIGQLEAVIGEFEGLQKIALKYVREVKVKQFLDQATPLLSTEQRLYILTNVCDSMLSDGNVALLENKLFQTILTAFGYDELSFEGYYQTIAIKNVKPFDTHEFKPKMTHRRLRGDGKEDGVTFEKKISLVDKGYQAPADTYTTAANQEVWSDNEGHAQMGALIQRTMQDNIEQVVSDFGSTANVIQVGHNATDELNVQKLAQSQNTDNVQHIGESLNTADNRQAIDGEEDRPNRQTVSENPSSTSRQTLVLAEVLPNLQTLDSDRLTTHREELTLEVRMQSLYEDIDGLNQRLNRFERENKDFLDAIRAEMLIDVAGVLTDISPEAQELLDMVDELQHIHPVAKIPMAHDGDNIQQIPQSDTSVNLQHIGVAAADENIQTVALTSAASNRQRIHQVKNLKFIDFSGQAIESEHRAKGGQATAMSADTVPIQDATSVKTHFAMSEATRPFAVGRHASAGLNWFYTHAKVAIVFVSCVFAMPMDMKLPVSRITSGFLITLASHSEHANIAKSDTPLAEHTAQEKIKEEVEQTFDLVRLTRD